MAMVKKEVSSDDIWKEAFLETPKCSVNHLTELHVYFVDLFSSLISVESENRCFGSL